MSWYDNYEDLDPFQREIARELERWNPFVDKDDIRREAEYMESRGMNAVDAIMWPIDEGGGT